MRKLVILILALFALFTLINAYTEVTNNTPAATPPAGSTAVYQGTSSDT